MSISKIKYFSAVTALVTMSSISVKAAGFQLPEQDSRAASMANAVTADLDNAAAAWYNPAAFSLMEGDYKNYYSAGMGIVQLEINHEYDGGEDKMNKKLHYLPYGFAARKLSDRFFLSLGVTAPYGLSSDWDADTRTGKVATYSEVKDINYNLNLSYKVLDNLAFAAGVDFVHLTAELDNDLVEMKDGEDYAFGYNAAMLYKATDRLSFGATYRSQVKSTLKADATWNKTKYAWLATKADGGVQADLTLPDNFQFGASYKVSPKLKVNAELGWTNWTTYDVLKVTYRSDGSTMVENENNWKAGWAYKLGTEYTLNKNWNLRAGVLYDYNPVPDEYFATRVPDSKRVGGSIGAGYHNENGFSVDFSFLYEKMLKHSVDSNTASVSYGTGLVYDTTVVDGDYSGQIFFPSVTFGYKF